MLLQEEMQLITQENLAPLIYKMVLKGELVESMDTPGQFIHLRVPGNDKLLRRPISICEINKEKKTCTIIYRIEGEGTKIFSHMKPGETIDVMGPLGNGFDIEEVTEGQTAFVIGGGIGTPPMFELAKTLKNKGAKVVTLLGYASKDVMFYQKEFQSVSDELYVSTDDGSFGTHGHVGMLLDELEQKGMKPDAVFACGANGLLKAVDSKFENHPKAYISMEARMACGMGACYACVVHVRGDETGAQSLKVCDQGPIFETGKVVL